MKKVLLNDEEREQFKKDYSDGVIETEVNSNLYNKYEGYRDYKKDLLLLEILISTYEERALTEIFGSYDFEFEANRLYKNWILEYDGMVFMASSKKEVVKNEDFFSKEEIEKVKNFDNALKVLVFDYIETIRDDLKDVEKKTFDNLKDTLIKKMKEDLNIKVVNNGMKL